MTIRQLAQAHPARLRADFGTVYAANLFGAGGGFLFRFGSLCADPTSNFGTPLVLAAHWTNLKCLARATEHRAIARWYAPTEKLEYEHGLPRRPTARDDILISPI